MFSSGFNPFEELPSFPSSKMPWELCIESVQWFETKVPNIQIGCKNLSIQEWFSMTDEEIAQMQPEALYWWSRIKEPLRGLLAAMGHEITEIPDSPERWLDDWC